MDYAELNFNVKFLVSNGYSFSDAFDIVWAFYKPFEDDDYISDDIFLSFPIEDVNLEVVNSEPEIDLNIGSDTEDDNNIIQVVPRQKRKREAVKVTLVNDHESDTDIMPTLSSVPRQKRKREAVKVILVNDHESDTDIMPTLSSVPRQKRKFYSMDRHNNMLDFQDEMADSREIISIITRRMEQRKIETDLRLKKIELEYKNKYNKSTKKQRVF